MADYSTGTTGNLSRPVDKKPRSSFPSEISISGQSDREASLASNDHYSYREDCADLLQPEEEAMDDNAAPEEEPNCDTTLDNNEEEEPKWDKLTSYINTRDQIQSFLSARECRSTADHRFTSSIDQLHDSVSASTDDLVHSVVELFNTKSDLLDEYERGLNVEYEENERRRGEMQMKLEESARAAQGLFANLLMRIAQPADALGGGVVGAAGMVGNGGEEGENEKRGDNEAGRGEEEPDWEAITKHEPAKAEVPIYLEARNRREMATARFETAIRDFQQSTEDCLQDLTQTMVDMYNERSAKLNEYECMLKQEYVENDEVRSKMQANIEESAQIASQVFEKLLNRVLDQESPGEEGRVESQFGAGSFTQATTLESP